jgi:hydrophobic/amphiphilic exporter-1 (mainly G- bacteria), HAE1 family
VIRLVSFFVERYVFSLAIFLAVVFFGLTAGTRLGVDLLPEFEFPIVAVTVSYPGAGSAETVTQVTEPVEDAVSTLPGITDVTSITGEGFAVVIAQFVYGTSIDQAAIDVKQRVDAVQPTLPDEVSAPTIQKFDPSDAPILQIALTAPGEDLLVIERVARDTIEPRLQQVPGVAAVTTIGPVDREVQVLLDPGRMEALRLAPREVAGAIRAAASTVPAGSLDVGGERILLSVRTSPERVEDVAEAYVDPARGVRVRDVATVRDTVASPSSFVRLGGESAVILEVRKTSGANAVATGSGVRTALEGVDLPSGFEATVIGDTTVFVANSVFDTVREMGLAVLAVAFIVLLFVGRLGSTFSVILAIPITITGAVIVFGLLGFSFNVVTLLAVTVAVGLVVDDSIVIAENIDRYRRMGHGLKESVLKGAGEVATAVLTATLSLLAVFLPVAFLPGVIGQFFSQFGLSLAATIFVSYLEAMFFLTVRLAYMPNPLPPTFRELPAALRALPADARWAARMPRRRRTWVAAAALGAIGAYAADAEWWLRPLHVSGSPWAALAVGAVATLGLVALSAPLAVSVRYLGRLLAFAVGAVVRALHDATDAGLRALRQGYAAALGWTLDRATAVLVVAGLLVASLGIIGPRISFNFVSEVDVGQVAVRVDMPPGTPLDRTDVVAARLEGVLRADPDVRSVLTTVGSSGTLGSPNAQRANLQAELIGISERRRSSVQVADDLRPLLRAAIADVPEASLRVGADDGGAIPVDTGIEIVLVSSDRSLLEERDRAARDLMAEHGSLLNVRSSVEGSVAERVFQVSAAALAGTGLTTSEVASMLRAYNVGVDAGQMRADGEETPIVVKIDPAFVRDEQTLLSLPIFAPALGSYLTLGQLGAFSVQAAPVSIRRSNQEFVATINADMVPGSPGQFQLRTEVEERLAAAGIVDDAVRVTTGVGPDLLGDLVFYGPIAFALALLLNYLVIASQFNSFTYPLYLLLTVPLALVGAFWLFFLTGTPLDVISVLGVVILIGLVTKNAILLLDVVVSQLEESETLRGALVRAGRLRLRPILMTALTVVIISVPLLLGIGEGTEFRRPLGLVILGGVVSSTFLTLFVVPAAFYRFERAGYARRAEALAAASGATLPAFDPTGDDHEQVPA